MADDKYKSTGQDFPQIKIDNRLPELDKKALIATILEGLLCEHKHVSSTLFYDEAGSQLFKAITGLPEYYIPRIEKSLIHAAAADLSDKLHDVQIIEFGSGDCSKISVLLAPVPAAQLPSICYVPVDVSASAIRETATNLPRLFPGIKIHGVLADFIRQAQLLATGARHIFCMFGSTIGNLTREEGMRFCAGVRAMMHDADIFLLGLDMVKDRDVLYAAYNDSQQVTAAFNRNILKVVNDLTGTGFDPRTFAHVAFFNEGEARIEMHLLAMATVSTSSPYCSTQIRLDSGEHIHTENSHKYTPQHIADLARAAGLKIAHVYTDKDNWFSLVAFRKSKGDYV